MKGNSKWIAILILIAVLVGAYFLFGGQSQDLEGKFNPFPKKPKPATETTTETPIDYESLDEFDKFVPQDNRPK